MKPCIFLHPCLDPNVGRLQVDVLVVKDQNTWLHSWAKHNMLISPWKTNREHVGKCWCKQQKEINLWWFPVPDTVNHINHVEVVRISFPIGSMYAIYMVTFTINIPPMLAYIAYRDPMGLCDSYPKSLTDVKPQEPGPRPKAVRIQGFLFWCFFFFKSALNGWFPRGFADQQNHKK
jgi:hypothetical protein